MQISKRLKVEDRGNNTAIIYTAPNQTRTEIEFLSDGGGVALYINGVEYFSSITAVVTKKRTIGNVGVTGCDYNFVTDPGTAEQCIDLGELIPAYSRLVDVIVVTDAAFTNLGALATDVGLTTGAGDLVAVIDNTAAGTIMYTANAGAFLLAPVATAQHVWLNCNPTNNWDAATPVGRMSVYVTYIDIGGI